MLGDISWDCEINIVADAFRDLWSTEDLGLYAPEDLQAEDVASMDD